MRKLPAQCCIRNGLFWRSAARIAYVSAAAVRCPLSGHFRSSSPTADYYQLLVRALTGLGKSPDEAWRAAFYARARGATSGSAICWRRASLLLGLINSFEVSSMLIQQTALDGHGPGDDLRPIRIGPTD